MTMPRVASVDVLKREDLQPSLGAASKVAHFRITQLVFVTANKEYTHQLAKGCKRFKIQCRDGTAVRVATATDIVKDSNPGYWTLKATVASGENSQIWQEDNLDIQDENMLIYFACGTAAKVLEIIEGF